MARRRMLRWVAPAAAVAVVGASMALAGTASADVSPVLPAVSAEQLLADVLSATPQPMSGTATFSADLGLPDVSLLSGLGGPMSGSGVVPGGIATAATGAAGAQVDLTATLTGLAGLVTGSHTVRVWSDGPDRSRVSVLTDGGEVGLFHNDTDVWLWQSAGSQVVHAALPAPVSELGAAANESLAQRLAQAKAEHPDLAAQIPASPQEAAARLLLAAGPTTDVAVGDTTRVVGRDAYQLVVTPKDAGSLVARIVVAIDAQSRLPLRTEAFSTQRTAPALSFGFTSVSLAAPAASTFQFSPPAGAVVQELAAPADATRPSGTDQQHPDATQPVVSVSGTGWASVVIIKPSVSKSTGAGAATEPAVGGQTSPAPSGKSARSGSASGANPSALLNQLLDPVSGGWGSGHALAGTLFSVLIADDGTVALGAVPVAALESALAATR